MEQNDKRLLNIDLLRILAAFSVVMLHSSAQFWYDLPIRSGDWVALNTYNSLSRVGVPLFVMISGALFLSKGPGTDLKRLYRHNILRLVILYVIWSALYGLLDCLNTGFANMGLRDVIRELIFGRFHLWFLPMLTGLYMLLPVLRVWVHNAEQKNIAYFLVLFLTFQILRFTALAFAENIGELLYLGELLEFDMICGYLGFFVLGYYLYRYPIELNIRKKLYICVIPAILFNVGVGNFLSLKREYAAANVYDSYGLGTFIIVVALFVFFVNSGEKWNFTDKCAALIRELSRDTLGVYLMHIACMEITKELGIHSMLITPVLGVPLYAIACFAFCTLLTAIIRRIPRIGAYIC